MSLIAIFRLVDNILLSRLHIVHMHNYKLNLFTNSNRDAGNTVGELQVAHRVRLDNVMFEFQCEYLYPFVFICS